MAVYRFKVSFEDNEEVYREIEIKSTQNFEDFHNVITQSINFDNVHDASFFISDNYWHKGDEIKLKPLNTEGTRNTEVAIRQMNKCKMASLIEDPHQKFVYIYDPKTAWTFLVELTKIVLDDAKVNYPLCVKSVGEAPKQYKNSNAIPVLLEDEEFDDEPATIDDEAYLNAHSDDEIAVLESEEGEEEIAETGEEESAEDEDEFGSSDAEDHAEQGTDED